MRIIGLGFDATDIPRVREVFARHGERFLRRVFTDEEIAYCTRQRDPVPSLAGRFAAKLIHPSKVGDALREGAARAIETAPRLRPLAPKRRSDVELAFLTSAMADMAELIPGTRRAGAGPRSCPG